MMVHFKLKSGLIVESTFSPNEENNVVQYFSEQKNKELPFNATDKEGNHISVKISDIKSIELFLD